MMRRAAVLGVLVLVAGAAAAGKPGGGWPTVSKGGAGAGNGGTKTGGGGGGGGSSSSSSSSSSSTGGGNGNGKGNKGGAGAPVRSSQVANPCITNLTWVAGSCVTSGELAGYCNQDFNVISFGDFCAWRGDIEGRLLVRGDVFIDPGGFSLGMELRTRAQDQEDAQRPYALVVGGDSLCWSHGSLFPDGSGVPHPSEAEGIFGARELPPSDCLPLAMSRRQTGMCGPAGTPDCLEDALDTMQTFYEALVDGWCTSTVRNTRWMVHYESGLFIKGLDPLAEELYVHIGKDVLNRITYFDLKDIQPQQRLIFLVHEEEADCAPTNFGMGAPIPWDARKVAWVFCTPTTAECPERRVWVHGGHRGSIIAPYHTYNQLQGVTEGFLVFGNIEKLHQANKLDCPVCPQICGFDCCRVDTDDFHCCAVNPDTADMSGTCCAGPANSTCCGNECGCLIGETCCLADDANEAEAQCVDADFCCEGVVCQETCCLTADGPVCPPPGFYCCSVGVVNRTVSSQQVLQQLCPLVVNNTANGTVTTYSSTCCGDGCGCQESPVLETCCPQPVGVDLCCPEANCCDGSDSGCCPTPCCGAGEACCSESESCCTTQNGATCCEQCCESSGSTAPDFCCRDDQVCCGLDGCCEDRCCQASGVCCDGEGVTCCNSVAQSAHVCCSANSTCCEGPSMQTADDNFCCDGECCGSNCCGGGSNTTCCNDLECCGADQACCDGGCCDAGVSCCGGECCASTSDRCCGDACCSVSNDCCEGECCPSGEECCDVSATAGGDVCCGDCCGPAVRAEDGGALEVCCNPGDLCCQNMPNTTTPTCCPDGTCCATSNSTGGVMVVVCCENACCTSPASGITVCCEEDEECDECTGECRACSDTPRLNQLLDAYEQVLRRTFGTTRLAAIHRTLDAQQQQQQQQPGDDSDEDATREGSAGAAGKRPVERHRGGGGRA